jgi:DNA polymerase-1
MLRVYAELQRRQLRTRLLLQVHDELVFELPDDELLEAKLLVRDAMTGAAELRVPLEVTLGHGANWLLAH